MAPHLTLHLLTKMLGMLLVLLAMGLVQGEVQVGEVQVEEMQGEVQVEEVQVGEVQMGEVEEVQGEGAATTWDPWAPCTTDADCPEGSHTCTLVRAGSQCRSSPPRSAV